MSNDDELFGVASELTRERDYHVYNYHFLDDHSFMRVAEQVLDGHHMAPSVLEGIKAKFRQAGWEGDGTVEVMWLPPFVGAGVEDTWGVYVWHVKQSNNGTSWLASPVPLPFPRLIEQNR